MISREPELYIDVVFDAPPGNQGGRFVEVEDPKGHSIGVGAWVKRADGYWVLRIPRIAREGARHKSSGGDMGGPAFPSPYEFISKNDQGNILCTTGALVWDRYAEAALTGLAGKVDTYRDGQDLVSDAAILADEMLIERKRRLGEA